MSLIPPKKIAKLAIAGLAFALGFTTPAWGFKMISKGSGKKGGEVPIRVTAERMEVDHASNTIRFSGNVVTTRASMVLRSDSLEVFNTGLGKNATGSRKDADEVSKIIARGNVEFEHETKRATGDEAVYLAQDKKVLLTGRMRAWDEEREVTGHQMTFYIDEDRSVVIRGNDRRVEVAIRPKDGRRQGFQASPKSNGGASQAGKSPIYVTADRMEADHQQKSVFFEGKVITKQADFRMDSDELEVFDSGRGDRQISKIVARGNVQLDRGGKIATGDKAIYYERDRKVLLIGNARAQEDKNIITGSRMEIFLDEDKSVVLGDGKEQVEVTIYPQEGPGATKQPLPLPTLTEDSAEATSRR